MSIRALLTLPLLSILLAAQPAQDPAALALLETVLALLELSVDLQELRSRADLPPARDQARLLYSLLRLRVRRRPEFRLRQSAGNAVQRSRLV